MAYKQIVLRVEVLYDDEISPNPEDMSLTDLEYEFTEGSMSARVTTQSVKTLTKKQVAKALEKQGSDPAFLTGEIDEEK